MTYKQAYDKIIEAYFKNQIKPLSADFCFCGTLAGGSNRWFGESCEWHKDFGNYKGREYVRMEVALFDGLKKSSGTEHWYNDMPGYEDALFSGMCAALDVLKQIHIERGEIVDDLPSLTKRVLV
jgi:hypothetical protein